MIPLMHKPCQPRVSTTSIITKKAYREEQPERFLRKDTEEDISICLNCTRKSCSGSKRCLLKRKGEQNNVNPARLRTPCIRPRHSGKRQYAA